MGAKVVTMAKDEAYYAAEKKIEKALKSDTIELNIQKWEVSYGRD